MTHEELDREFSKLSKYWKEMALKFVGLEKFIEMTREEVEKLKEEMKKERENAAKKIGAS